MPFLVDTNVLLRRARLSDPHYPAARNAIDTLAQKGEAMYISSQTSSSAGTCSPDRLGVMVSAYRRVRQIKKSRNLNHSFGSCTTHPTCMCIGGDWWFRLACLV
jgi:hypothetical protein